MTLSGSVVIIVKSLGWDDLSSTVFRSVQLEERFFGINITH
jgi:hypothetical protein